MADLDQTAGLDSAAAIAAVRRRLRSERLAARNALDSTTHALRSQQACAAIAALLADHTPSSLGFCTPFGSELDIAPLLPDLLAAGWHLCVPVVATVAAPMEFRSWGPDAPTGLDPHGIAIPLTAPCPAPDILLLPSVAVDTLGYRLGYGGGYFDRTLEALAARGRRPYCIGMGFELACVDSIAPQTHDQPLDVFVSEAGATLFAPTGASAA